MDTAGEPDGRWYASRKRGTGGKSGLHRTARLVTPGGRAREDAATDSATESKPPALSLGERREAKPCAALDSWKRPVRVKRWGKSPPLLRQRRRHGKPRAEQGQIGGEDRSGPQPRQPGDGTPGGKPSGRSHEPRSNPWPRGMAVRARDARNRTVRLTESGLYGSPAYFSVIYGNSRSPT